MRLMHKSIRFIVCCMPLFLPNNSFPADKSMQHTEGDQAPIVNVGPGGKSTINYGVPGELIANIVPEIASIMTYPMKLERGRVRKQIDNPDITITNVGPIKAVGFSVDLRSYLYDKKLGLIEGDTELRKDTHGHFIFKNELQPAEEIKQQVNGYLCQDKVAIYVLSLKYYREADMKAFDRQVMFFMDNYEILPEKDYTRNSEYPKIIQAIKSYRPPADAGKTCLEAIDDHAWFLKQTQKTGLVVLTGGGKALTISGIPEDPRTVVKQSYVGDNRPVLYITPAKVKESGTYLNPKIIDAGTVNISFRYEVENVGDLEAIRVSEAGGTPYAKPVIPGGKIYLNSEVTVMNKGTGSQTAQDLVRDIDKKDFSLEHHDTVVYYQESRDEEYIVKFVYRIGKDSVRLIRYELN